MKSVKILYGIILGNVVLQLAIWLFVQDEARVEALYSRGFYAWYAHLPKWVFGWIPFSMGDLFYVAVVVLFLLWIFRLMRFGFRKQWRAGYRQLLRIVCLALLLYNFFYLSWGLHYYRVPLSTTFSLQTDAISREEYQDVLEEFIDSANTIRQQIDRDVLDKSGVKTELQELMKNPTVFDRVLIKSQVRVKQPLSSALVSYFMVTGYFNPFTHEVQVNEASPIIAYPFTTVHELAHQMGIGFEDECNFIAFRMLVDHENAWYRYAAYYEAIQSLLRPIRYWDKTRFDVYYARLDDGIKKDFAEERAFWEKHIGFIDAVTGPFYNAFLQHNNQPEGTERYSMMNRLIVAWKRNEKQPSASDVL